MRIRNNIVEEDQLAEIPNVTLGQNIYDNLKSNPDAVLQIDVDMEVSYTRQEILDKSIILATYLKKYGINVEDRISIASENHEDYITVLCATQFVAATIAPLNFGYTEREYRHMLGILEPRIIFVSRTTEKLLSKIVPTLGWTVTLIQMQERAFDPSVVTLKEILVKYRSTPETYKFEPVKVDDNRKRMAAIMCSSGTTGFPKGVMLSHMNFLVFLQTSRDSSVMDIRPGDKSVVFLPMFHGYAFGMMNLAIGCGSTMCMMRRYDILKFLDAVQKYKVTHMPIVPPILITFAKHPLVPKYDFSSVREVLCGASPLPKDMASEMKRRTKIKYIRNGYGMTELTVVSNMSVRDANDETVGAPLPSFAMKVVNPETNETLGPRQTGELCYKGPHVMLGYYKNPKATKEAIDEDNWMHTGDLGYFTEDGLTYVTGRIKELIKYKGFQVSPSEIEALLVTHPAVRDAGVVGVPDERCGEIPRAFVVKQPGKDVTAEELMKFANENLSVQKWIRGGIRFVQEIPKTPSGKIVRRELSKLNSHL